MTKKFDDAALKLNDFLLNVKRTKFPDGLPISQISEFYSLHPGLKSIIRSLGLKKFIMRYPLMFVWKRWGSSYKVDSYVPNMTWNSSSDHSSENVSQEETLLVSATV
mmetsp:Transcript_16799/g.19044  ORF Transcript_16799/g.19044 Transcript_16799/m.19044 type:complete len:107 (+) Transcript_16799:11-331(+)